MPESTARKVRRRSAREGSVYPYRDGHRGAITWTDPEGSRHKRTTVKCRTAEEARDKLDELRRDLKLGVLTSGSPATVGEYLTGWIDRHRGKVRASTWLTAESYVRVYLIPALGRRPLARLTAADVDTALASFQRDGRPVQAGDNGPGSRYRP